MDTLFLCVHGIKNIVGATNVTKIVQKDGDSWLPITSASWKVSRNISMDIGNATNSDTGEVSVGELVITKPVDGLTPAINTILFKPVKGRCVDIIYATPEVDGSGYVRQRVVTFDNAKVVDYTVKTEYSEEEGSVAVEEIRISYSVIVAKYQPTKLNGELEDPTTGVVEYDFDAGKLSSGIEIK